MAVEGGRIPDKTARREVTLRLRHLPAGAVSATVDSGIRTVDGVRRALTRPKLITSRLHAQNNNDENAQATSPRLLRDAPPLPQPKENTVTLGMFNSRNPKELAPLMRHYVGRDIDVIAAHADPKIHAEYEERRWARYQRYHPGVTREQYDLERDEQLRRQKDARDIRMNRHVFGRIRDEIGRGTEESAASVFEIQRQHANAAVRNNADLVFTGDTRTELRQEVDLPQRPADLVDMYFSSSRDSDPTLVSEIQRQALLTAVSTQIERGRSGRAGMKLTQIQNLLDEQLFTGKKGETTMKDIYGVFDNETNAVVVDADGKPQIVIDEAPTEEAPEGTHYKLFTWPMRQIKGTGEFVLNPAGEKERKSSLSKALYNAYRNARNGKEDDIRAKDIEDTHRMMLVVNGDDAAAERLLERVFDIVTDGVNALSLCNKDYLGRPVKDNDGELTGLLVDYKMKPGTKDGNGDAQKVGNHRVLLYFDGLATPIEVIVKPLYNHLLSKSEVGEYEPGTNRYTGVAHDNFKIGKRETDLSDIYFSHEVYPDLVRPNVPNEDGIYPTHPGLERAVRALREEAVFVPSVTNINEN